MLPSDSRMHNLPVSFNFSIFFFFTQQQIKRHKTCFLFALFSFKTHKTTGIAARRRRFSSADLAFSRQQGAPCLADQRVICHASPMSRTRFFCSAAENSIILQNLGTRSEGGTQRAQNDKMHIFKRGQKKRRIAPFKAPLQRVGGERGRTFSSRTKLRYDVHTSVVVGGPTERLREVELIDAVAPGCC